MNIYKAPNLIISPERKVYRRGGGVLNDESIYIHKHCLSISLPLSLSLPPPLHTYIYHSVGKRRLLEREKMYL